MDAACSSEMLIIIYHATLRHISESSSLLVGQLSEKSNNNKRRILNILPEYIHINEGSVAVFGYSQFLSE
jgi:hypothetical protein